MRTRFAPSPTGALHLGNARTALVAWLYARSRGGRFLLRIEDTDRERSGDAHVAGLLEDLRWLGLGWDEGPASATPEPAHFQSQRGDVYRAYFDRLESDGHAYPCFCTPEELAQDRQAAIAAHRPPRYAGRCRGLAPDERARRRREGRAEALRFALPATGGIEILDMVRGPVRFSWPDLGDFVIRRADGSAAFLFSNALDDALMGVSHVWRGEDHLANTPRQCAILDALSLAWPHYGHLALIAGDDDVPLSKRRGDLSVQALRAQGYLALAITNYLARLGYSGRSERLEELAALAEGYEPLHLGRAQVHHDLTQLRHWQRLAVAALAPSALGQWAAPALSGVPDGDRPAFLAAIHANLLFPGDARAWVAVVYADEITPDVDAQAEIARAGASFFSEVVRVYADTPAGQGGFFKTLSQATGRRGHDLYAPLRAALTGQLAGPELGALLALMPRERVAARFQRFAGTSEGHA